MVVCGAGYGRVKAMYDTLKPRLKHEEAGPSTPVNVTGLSVAPGAGDRFYVLADISQARQLAERRAADSRQKELGGGREHVTLENLFERLGAAGPGADAATSFSAPTSAARSRRSARRWASCSIPRCRSRFCRPRWAASPRPTSIWPTPPTR